MTVRTPLIYYCNCLHPFPIPITKTHVANGSNVHQFPTLTLIFLSI